MFRGRKTREGKEKGIDGGAKEEIEPHLICHSPQLEPPIRKALDDLQQPMSQAQLKRDPPQSAHPFHGLSFRFPPRRPILQGG